MRNFLNLIRVRLDDSRTTARLKQLYLFPLRVAVAVVALPFLAACAFADCCLTVWRSTSRDWNHKPMPTEVAQLLRSLMANASARCSAH